MRLLYWLYALLAFGLCAFLFLHLRRAESADPRALLEHARGAMSGPELDLVLAGHELDSALAAAERDVDRPLIEEILLQRAKLERQTNAFVAAKADLENVLTHFRPGSPAIESMLAAVTLDSGDVEGALQRADSVLKRDPNQAEAWGVRAEALLTLADRIIEDGMRTAGVAVASNGLSETEKLMRRIAARPVADVERLRLVQELHDAFPETDKELAREISQRLDDASALLEKAPEALAESLRGGLRPAAVVAYVRTLNDAGESDAAADLGLAALSFPPFRTNAALLRLMLDVLTECGRASAAAELIDPSLVRRVALDSDFYCAWARALHASEDWTMLSVAGNSIRGAGSIDLRPLGDFYIGLGLSKRGKHTEAATFLRRFLQSRAPQPIEDSKAIAWIALADAMHAQNAFADEADALRRGLAAASLKLSGQGDVWLRLAQIELDKSPPPLGIALEDLAQALRLTPERRAELETRWRSLGAEFARVRKVDFEKQAEALDRAGRLTPVDTLASYDYVRLAEVQFERGRYVSSAALAQRALELYPDFPPALEIGADAAFAAESWSDAARLLRERLRVEGASPKVVDAMLQLPPEVLGPDWRIELVRLDPTGVGRRWAAEALRDRGEVARAIDSLERLSPERRSDSDHRLLAELYFDQGKMDQAQEQLARLSPDLDVLVDAAPLMLSIAARLRDEKHAQRIFQLLEVKSELDVESFLEAVDELIVHGMFATAKTACEMLDTRVHWRSSEVSLRLAQLALLTNDMPAAHEALERALAYDTTGSAELGLLIEAVQARRWEDCGALYDQVHDSALEPTPTQFVALAAIGDRPEEARAVLDAELRQRLQSATTGGDATATPLEQLLASALNALASTPRELDPLTAQQGFGALPADAVQRDPRPLLARLAALDQPNWTAWAVADLAREAPPQRGALWPAYLAARGAAWLNIPKEAERIGRSLVAAWPSFTPAWDVLQSAVEEQVRRPDHPRILQLAQQRRAALGSATAGAADAALLDARLARARDDLATAAQRIEAAIAIDPERATYQREKAQIARARKQWATAIDSFHLALASTPGGSDRQTVREFIELLREAHAAQGPAFDVVLKREFDFLVDVFPQDPLARLEATRFLHPFERATDRLVAEHAVSELQYFRAQNPAGLEELRPGVAVLWADFYASFDPRRAHELVDEELKRTPHVAELWQKKGELAAQLRRYDEAIAATQTALGMAPSPMTARALVDLHARRGDGEAEILAETQRVAAIVGVAETDRELQLALARALAHGRRASLARGLQILAQLWSSRDAKARESEMVEVGLLYGAALCRRASSGDAAIAFDVLTQIAPRVTDPLQSSLVTTLHRLAATLRARG